MTETMVQITQSELELNNQAKARFTLAKQKRAERDEVREAIGVKRGEVKSRKEKEKQLELEIDSVIAGSDDDAESNEAERLAVARKKQAERDGLRAEIAEYKEGIKQLKSTEKQLEGEIDSILSSDSPRINQPVQLRMPFGVSDSPLSALGLRKAHSSILTSVGIERVPDLVDVVSLNNPKFPNGLESVKELKPNQAKQIANLLQQYLEKEPGRPKSEEPPPKVADVNWPDRAKILVDTAEGFEKDSIISGKVADDGTFVTEGYSFIEGEYEVVSA